MMTEARLANGPMEADPRSFLTVEMQRKAGRGSVTVSVQTVDGNMTVTHSWDIGVQECEEIARAFAEVAAAVRASPSRGLL